LRHVPAVLLGLGFLTLLGGPFLLRPPMQEVRATKRLVVITVHSEEIKTEFERAFSEWTASTRGYGVVIDWRDVGGTTSAIKYVEDRFKQAPEGAGIGVDVFFGGGMDPFLRFGPRGLLRPCNIPEEVLSRIPQNHKGLEIYDKNHLWFGACLSSFGILYNKEVLRRLNLPEPLTWADLGRPDYYTWVSSGDPRQSGSIHMAYEIMLQAYGWHDGWEYLVRMGGNCRRFSSNASAVPMDVAAGDAACGMAIDVYALRAVAEAGEDRMGFRLPKGLTVVNPDCIGVLKDGSEPELAELFVQFVLSEAGQRLWILRKGAPGGPKEYDLYRLSVIPGLAKLYGDDAAVQFDPFSFEGGFEFDAERKNRRWQVVNDMIGACIIDTQEELADAWGVLRRLPESDSRVQALLKPPAPEEELEGLNEKESKDPAFRGDLIARWSRTSAERYRQLAEGR
jgi:ABC-type Fe3+ transport system substrate-binding protein